MKKRLLGGINIEGFRPLGSMERFRNQVALCHGFIGLWTLTNTYTGGCGVKYFTLSSSEKTTKNHFFRFLNFRCVAIEFVVCNH